MKCSATNKTDGCPCGIPAHTIHNKKAYCHIHLKKVKEYEATHRLIGTCSICTEDAIASQPYIVLDCKHVYHRACLRPWIEQKWREPTCPCCRGVLAEMTCLQVDPAHLLRKQLHEHQRKKIQVAISETYTLSFPETLNEVDHVRTLIRGLQEWVSIHQSLHYRIQGLSSIK